MINVIPISVSYSHSLIATENYLKVEWMTKKMKILENNYTNLESDNKKMK